MVQKEKKIFHDIFEDNAIDGQRLFGVKLSIDEKVIAKPEQLQKKEAEEKASQRAYFAFQEKWIGNNINFTQNFSFIK
jgi:ribonuclease-3